MRRTIGRLAVVCAAFALTASCSLQPSGFGVIARQLPDEPTHAPEPMRPPPELEEPRFVEAPTETHQGKGNATVPLTWPSGVAGFLKFDCPKCDGHIAVKTDGTDSLLVNASAPYHGTAWFNVSLGGKWVHKLDITADAAWTATITDYRGLPSVEAGKPYSAHGDAVLAIPAGMTRGKFATKSKGHTGVWTLCDGERDLVVNQIIPYEGEFPLHGQAFVAVEAYDGDWTFTAS